MEISIPSLLRIKPKAIYKIGKYLRKEGLSQVAVFYGEGIREILEQIVQVSLDSSEIRNCNTETVSSNDMTDILARAFSLPKGIEAIVAIGGGKVIDFCKYMAFLLQLPLISVPTSIANDGFASPMASLVVNGKRRSMKAAMPYGVIVDTQVIQNAPMRFTLSGIGDLISKYTAVQDWKMANKKRGENVNDFAVLISINSADIFVNFPNKDLKNEEFIRMIAGSLVMSGVAMEISGSSRPASGAEHLISHAYDRTAAQPSLHGLQVGFATYVTSWLQGNRHELIRDTLSSCGFFDFLKQNPLSKADFLNAVQIAPTIKENYHTILSEEDAMAKLLGFVENDPLCQEILR